MKNQSNNNQIKAIIYCRVSSERQKKEGHGLESQEHRCKEYAKTKGYEVEIVFKDSFTGGGDFMKRPGMASLLGYADKHAYKTYVVIFDDLSRFARDVSAHIKLRQEFDTRNIKIECPNFTFEDTPEGELVENIMAAQNQYHRKSNRRQVIQKQKARLESGYWPFFPPPGYDQTDDLIHGKLLRPNEKATTIKEAFEGFASGRFREQIDVQKFLQLQHFLGDRPVYLECVKRLLSRIIYTGYIEFPNWDVERRKGQHKGIIDIETFEKAQEKLKGRTFKMGKHNKDFPLRGLVLCKKCGRKMTAGWTKGRSKYYPFYKCQRTRCKEKDIRKEKIEGDFLDFLKGIKPKKDLVKLAERMILDAWKEKVKNLEKITGDHENRKGKFKRNIEQLIDKIIVTQSKQVIKRIEERIEEIEEEISKIDKLIINSSNTKQDYGTTVKFIISLLENPALVWENGRYNKKQLIAKLVFVENPIYDRVSGYGTNNLSIGVKLFEQISDHETQDVEMARIELAFNKGFEKFLQEIVCFRFFKG